MVSIRSQSAFSLVELSIVLVILGLLVGGVLSGQSLIRAAEWRNLSAQMSNYRTATYTFRDKYFALPGDMNNAVAFWGAQAGSPTAVGLDATCSAVTTAATGTATCNGNGDGKMGSTITAEAAEQRHERYRAWHHLQNAGLIEGGFSGVFDVGVYSPLTKMDSSARVSVLFMQPSTSTTYFTTNVGNMYHVGRYASGSSTLGAFATPTEVWNIDTKLDDGKPDTGIVLSMRSTSTITPGCVVLNGSISEYNLVDSGKICSMIVLIGI